VRETGLFGAGVFEFDPRMPRYEMETVLIVYAQLTMKSQYSDKQKD
jgi:hypothetical protein